MTPHNPSQSTHLLFKASYDTTNLTPSSSNLLKRFRTPNTIEADATRHAASSHGGDKEEGPGERRRRTLMQDLYARSDRILDGFFNDPRAWYRAQQTQTIAQLHPSQNINDTSTSLRIAQKRSARAVDEDDYGDEDDEGEDEALQPSPLKHKDLKATRPPPRLQQPSFDKSNKPEITSQTQSEHDKTSEDAGRIFQKEKAADEQAAMQSFQDLFFTLENDHDAMMEQQKLDDLDRQVEEETVGPSDEADVPEQTNALQQGSLSSVSLGATSLMLRHLIAKVDKNRHKVKASDEQIKRLLSDVRRNRSKWANEERVGQEELYEPAEHVLNELKGMTEYSTPFLKAVSTRDAPDYKKMITKPMDIGSMIKKLKNTEYKSKKDFCDDLELIWSNCLRYNAAPDHPLRRKAEHMRKETARLTTLIPDIVVRNRAEVEAEERRLHPEFDDAEESEDEPLMSTRGRKAPAKSSKGNTSSTGRKAPAPANDGNSTPIPDAKPFSQSQPSLDALSIFKKEHLRLDASCGGGSQRGMTSTPPPGDSTPLGEDASEIEGAEPSVNGVGHGHEEEVDDEDEEYQTWRQVTKKDRARVAQERNRLFTSTHKLNVDEPALLRSRGVMRRFVKRRNAARSRHINEEQVAEEIIIEPEQAQSSTLAEGMDVDDDNTLPDYYLPLSNVPAIDERLDWTQDAEGYVIDQKAELLRALPPNIFHAPQSRLTKTIDAHMRQMQDTRKVSHQIGVVKQMQIQSQVRKHSKSRHLITELTLNQTYQNQFQKFEIVPLAQPDVDPFVVSDDGPIMDTEVSRAALKCTVGKIFYHAGFEGFHPSALEAVTDLTSSYFTELVNTLGIYRESAKIPQSVPATVQQPAIVKGELKPRFTDEEAVLHTLQAFSHDVDGLDAYIEDDMQRLTSRLDAHHKRTRDYYADLLKPVSNQEDTRAEGINFNDGNENFLGGNFAEDIDEDFFGFRELGLDKEFGMPGLSVPLHLLQSRFSAQLQPSAAAATPGEGLLMPEPSRYVPITIENIDQQVGVVRAFFRKRLEDNDDEPLMEDDDLPVKQRYPKPRLPPTGKISSPRKRPIKEQQQMARKKRRLELAEKQREKDKGAGIPETTNGTDPAPFATKSDFTADAAKPESGDAPPSAEAPMGNGDMAEGEADTSADKDGAKDTEPPMLNGGTTTLPAEVSGDGPTDLDALFEDGDKPLTPKSVQRLKLEAPTKPTKAGDPEKKMAPSSNGPTTNGASLQRRDSTKSNKKERGTDDGDAEGDEDDEGDGRTGMISPESMPIAAH